MIDSWLVIGKATTFNAAGMVALSMGILAVLFLPRKLIAVAFIVIACFTTMGQQLVVASMSLSILRLMISATVVRAVLRQGSGLGSPTRLDKALVISVVVGALMYILRLQTTSALINQLGTSYDAIGLFFVFRYSIKEFDDLHVVITALALAITGLMFLMTLEKVTGFNHFAVFGGVPEGTIMREGHLRAQGPFRHPILAGTFAATSIPLFAAMWHGDRRRDRLLSAIGTLSSFVIVVLTASSGPLIATAAALLSLLLWPLRKKIRTLWYLFLVGLIALQAVMKAPVWYLSARASDILGGTGWHRAFLIDQAIKFFGEWWIAGTSNTALWMPYQLGIYPKMSDITNQFIAVGVSGGILALCAFIGMIAVAFRTLRVSARADTFSPLEARMVWALWGSLVVHVVTFFSVTYFDQIIVFWYLLLACISLVSSKVASGQLLFAKRVAAGSNSRA